VTPSERAAPSGSITERPRAPKALDYLTQIWAVASAEAQKLRHDPYELAMRAVQPALWLVLFGEVMAQLRGLSSGNIRYLDFLSAGVLAQSVLFVAIFFGISAIWERDLGVLQRYLVSPAPRTVLVIGKALSASVRALSQAVIVYGLAVLLGVDLNLSPLDMAGVVALVVLGSALFSTLSLIIACTVKTRERFMGIGQIITMPIFFASNAIYPLALMPSWLRGIASMNPLTYEVDALRAMMLQGAASSFGLGMDFGVLLGLTTILIVIAGRMYPRLAV
jgi:ABC-2 type transport system permease protein